MRQYGGMADEVVGLCCCYRKRSRNEIEGGWVAVGGLSWPDEGIGELCGRARKVGDQWVVEELKVRPTRILKTRPRSWEGTMAVGCRQNRFRVQEEEGSSESNICEFLGFL